MSNKTQQNAVISNQSSKSDIFFSLNGKYSEEQERTDHTEASCIPKNFPFLSIISQIGNGFTLATTVRRYLED